MKEVKRTNIVVVRNPQQGQGEREGRIRRDLYIIDVDRERNCYSCGEFGHLVWNCRNCEIVGQGRNIEYRSNWNSSNNLKRRKV